MSELNSEQQFEQGRAEAFAHMGQKLDAAEQTFGDSAAPNLGYREMESVNPLPSDHSDVEVTRTELEDAAAALQKSRDEALGKGPGEVVVREYKAADNQDKKLDEQLTVSAEQAAADLAAARDREANTVEVDEKAELARMIDALRAGQPIPESQRIPLTPAQIDGLTEDQKDQIWQQTADVEREANAAMVKVLESNPQILAAVQAEVTQRSEQARAYENYVYDHFSNALVHNAHAAAASLVVNFPELNGLAPEQLGTAIKVIAGRDPARAQAVINHIDSISGLVKQGVAAQQAQQQRQAQQYQAAFARDAAQSDAAYDRWSRSQGVSPEQQKAIKDEAMAEFRRQGWNDDQIAYAYNTNTAMRSLAGQIQMHQAAAYRLQQKSMSNVRRNKLDRTPPHVQRPGSPVHYDRGADYDHFERQQFKRIDSRPGTDAHKAGAAIIAARRRAKGGQW